MRAAKTLLFCVVAALTVAACTTTPSRTMSAQHFANTVASSDQFEIASSRLALSKSHNKTVKRIARQMIADHTKSTNELKSVLISSGMPLPQPILSPKHSAEFDRLAKAHPFHTAYLDSQEQAHAEAIELFEQYSANGDNEQLRAFADRTLPTLRHHYDMIRQAKR